MKTTHVVNEYSLRHSSRVVLLFVSALVNDASPDRQFTKSPIPRTTELGVTDCS